MKEKEKKGETMEANLTLSEDYREEFPGLFRFELPGKVAEYFGSEWELVREPLQGKRPFVYTGYVVDTLGRFAIGTHGPEVISGGNITDLRILAFNWALAEVILIGSETLLREPNTRWSLKHLFTIPGLAEDEAFQRDLLTLHDGLMLQRRDPVTVVLSRSGEIRTRSTLFRDPSAKAYLATTEHGAAIAQEEYGVPEGQIILCGAEEVINPHELFGYLVQAEGIGTVSYQGGRGALSSFLHAGLLDELFLSQMGQETHAEGEPKFLFRDHGVEPPTSARLITRRRAEGITLGNYDMRNVRSF